MRLGFEFLCERLFFKNSFIWCYNERKKADNADTRKWQRRPTRGRCFTCPMISLVLLTKWVPSWHPVDWQLKQCIRGLFFCSHLHCWMSSKNCGLCCINSIISKNCLVPGQSKSSYFKNLFLMQSFEATNFPTQKCEFLKFSLSNWIWNKHYLVWIIITVSI